MINWIIEGIFRAVYYALIFPILKLLNASSTVIEILSGKEIFDAIMFNQTNNNKVITVPLFFLIFTIAAVIILVLVFIINIIIAMTKEELQFQERMINAIKNTGKAGIVLIGIPIFFFILNYAIDSFTKMILNLNSHSGEPHKLGNIAWESGFIGNIKVDKLEWQSREDQSLLVTAFVTGFMFYCIFITGLAIVKRIFVLFFLYCISPWVAITFPIDNGKRLLVWKDLVIANFLSATAILFSFQIFSIVLPKLLQTELLQKLEAFSRTFIQILLAAGGAIFTLSAQGYINNFIGQSVSLSEGRQMALGLKAIHGGTVAGLGLAKTALGLGKLKSGSSGNSSTTNNGDSPSSVFKSSILTGYRQKGIWGGAAATIGKTGRVISKTSQGLASLVGATSAIIKNPVQSTKSGWNATKENISKTAILTKDTLARKKQLAKCTLKQKAKQSNQKMKYKIDKLQANENLQQILKTEPTVKKEGKE